MQVQVLSPVLELIVSLLAKDYKFNYSEAMRCEDCKTWEEQCERCAYDEDREAWYTAMEIIDQGPIVHR